MMSISVLCSCIVSFLVHINNSILLNIAVICRNIAVSCRNVIHNAGSTVENYAQDNARMSKLS